jgi:AI-2E family transporter
LIAPIFFVALTTIEGHFVTPNIVGRNLNLSPLIVFLALAFWTWLWGPIGAFSRYADSDHWIGGVEAVSSRRTDRVG